MANTVVATVTSSQQTFPNDPSIKNYQFLIVDSAGVPLAGVQGQTFTTLPTQVTFLNVPMGTGYQVKGGAYNANNALVGTGVFSPPFDVAGIIVTVIGAISVVVQ